MISAETREQIQKILVNLESPVKLLFFTQKDACPGCRQQLELLQELVKLSNKIELKVYDFILHGNEVAMYRIDKIPATMVIGKKDYGIRFYGLTAGYEFTSLIEAIIMVSTGHSGLNEYLETLVEDIKDRVHIQIFVTLTCPYCPKMVHVAHQFAFVNGNIQADMVETAEFPHLTQKYNVVGVPKTVINEVYSFEGALPEATVYIEILKAVNPERYRAIEEEIREVQGLRKASRVDDKHEYEVIIVGGGPAAMSAAIYSARKGLDVALIAKKLGGQIGYTATIENYLGFPTINGIDLVEQFRVHLERNAIAESLGEDVTQVKIDGNGFVVVTENGAQYRASSIIYAAGNEYRQLGVPGEELFIGKGIGFCATCDAPLYMNRKVVVVGGGNSAFTAVRDLLNFASEVHLIHRHKEFKADEALVQEVAKARNVTFHTPMNVKAFLGKDKLTGVRLESVDGMDRLDLNVDGVFLEIGFSPNSSPLKNLVKLNDCNEVLTDRDQATSVKGLFAAGDVTDVKDKQISIAVGQGALAALSAHRYLVENKLTKTKVGLKETWQ
ncbi:MAG: hypothetical protein QG670_574 [Thermoproteota archaeon]|nr:hypothetical protein [Thermoproteota archaeon]